MGEVLGAYVEAGDYLFLKYAASVAPSVMAGFIEVEDRRGHVQPYEVEVKSFTIDRTIQDNEDVAVEVQQDGKIVGGGIRRNADKLNRGQCYAILSVQRRLGADLLVSKGYVYSTNPIGLGEFEGAATGMGNLFRNTIVDDVTPVDVTKALALTNTRRLIHGFIWYYHCSSDSASRTMNVALRNLGGDQPTGMTSGTKTAIWNSGQVPLIADEEGVIYASSQGGRDGMVVRNDDGIVTTLSTATAPGPWPLSLMEGDNAELFFDVGSAHVNDRHSIYLIVEEWFSF